MSNFCGRIGEHMGRCWDFFGQKKSLLEPYDPHNPAAEPMLMHGRTGSGSSSIPEEEGKKRSWTAIGGRGLLTVSAFVARGFDVDPVLNAFSALIAGGGVTSTAEAVLPNHVDGVRDLSRCMWNTLFISIFEDFFYANGAMFNKDAPKTEASSTFLDVFALGVHLYIIGAYLKDNWRSAEDTSPSQKRQSASSSSLVVRDLEANKLELSDAKFAQPFWRNPYFIGSRDAVGSIVCGVVSGEVEDPPVKAILEFLSMYFASELSGEAVGEYTHAKIAKADANSSKGATLYRGFRLLFANLNTLTPLLFFPRLSNAFTFTQDWFNKVRFYAIPIGFSEGVKGSTRRLRSRNIPILEQPKYKKTEVSKNRYYRNAKITFGITQTLGELGFLAWQIGFDGNDEIQVKTLCVMMGSYCIALLILAPTAGTWNREKSVAEKEEDKFSLSERRVVRIKDQAVQFLDAPNILGLVPFAFYGVVTTTVRMDSDELNNAPNARLVMIISAYGIKTAAQVAEALKTWGTLRLNEGEMPPILTIDAELTFDRMLAGVIR